MAGAVSGLNGCFNTQPPEGGWSREKKAKRAPKHCFNTQPPEGGWCLWLADDVGNGCFNTQPPEGGWLSCFQIQIARQGFQHTAARRRLDRG